MTRRRRGVARPRLALLTAGVAAGLALTACGSAAPSVGDVHGTSPTGPSQATTLEGTLVVLAAASLTDVVTDLATRLEQQHPRLTVETGFGASPTLAAQVLGGAPADVLVTAGPATTARVTDALGGTPVVVAANRLQLAVPAGNPGGVTSLADLADPGLTVALCAPEVPCGTLAAAVLTRAGVTPSPDTLEPDARAVLARLRLDEADAGLVYRTDVLAAGGLVTGIDLPADVQETTDYPALALPDAPNPAAAAAFVALLTGPEGRSLLADAGFELP